MIFINKMNVSSSIGGGSRPGGGTGTGLMSYVPSPITQGLSMGGINLTAMGSSLQANASMSLGGT